MCDINGAVKKISYSTMIYIYITQITQTNNNKKLFQLLAIPAQFPDRHVGAEEMFIFLPG